MTKDTKEVSSGELSDGNISVAENGINEKALLRKIDGHLLPAVGILYLLSFLDRSNGARSKRYTWNIDRSTNVFLQLETHASRA